MDENIRRDVSQRISEIPNGIMAMYKDKQNKSARMNLDLSLLRKLPDIGGKNKIRSTSNLENGTDDKINEGYTNMNSNENNLKQMFAKRLSD